MGSRVRIAISSANVKIIACVHGFLSAWSKEYAKMGFVWIFVLTEACIAIDAVGAFLNAKLCYIFVEFANLSY